MGFFLDYTKTYQLFPAIHFMTEGRSIRKYTAYVNNKKRLSTHLEFPLLCHSVKIAGVIILGAACTQDWLIVMENTVPQTSIQLFERLPAMHTQHRKTPFHYWPL